ncbi:MAG TPA: dTMP kinase [Candidatus Gracilibacteria bacterium]|nr:dTMP kinase [Candidatus Gracilibacteria bacterium]
MFIVFEGLDGSGSSTQARLLKSYFESQGKEVILTKEPTENPIGKMIRDCLQNRIELSPRALQLLFAADRAEHLHTLISPSLNQDKIVISDRYYFSSIAFGGIDLEFEWLRSLYQSFLQPDLVFLLKVEPKTCIERIHKRGTPMELFEKEETLRRVWNNYTLLAELYPCIRLIDGNENIEEVQAKIINIVKTQNTL